MSEILYASREPRLPTEAELRTGRPVLGRTTITTIEAQNALVGAWCKRIIPFHCTLRTDTLVNDGGRAASLRYDYRPRWVSGPGETHAWIGLLVVADAGQSTPPEVAAEIRNAAGAVVDAGITWTTSDGSLPTSPMHPLLQLWGPLTGGEKFIETGWLTAVEVAGGPRLLELGPPGTLNEVRFSPLGTRLLGGLIVAANRGRLTGP